MNAVEIEQAISALAEQEFEAEEFPFAFLQAFGNKSTTIRKLRSGNTNKSDLGGVLQTNNIHIKVCAAGQVTQTLLALKESPATTRAKAKFVLATDGTDFEAEDLNSGETVACEYRDFPDHFGFFLPLAGISTVQQIRENAFDIRATSKLNKLYVQLLTDNPEWGAADRRPEMNHFMARLIFCFFAEDTDIFNGSGLYTNTIEQMSAKDSSDTNFVISEIFRAMNTPIADRESSDLPRWADQFPYVNGGLFSGSTETPRFSKIARSYLIHIGNLDWQKINPDIFGSMIQAVADDEERGALGMHYTSVPNILKVLNPLFLDDLREKLEEAGTNRRKLQNLRRRMSKIRVFDPACGSGNFLVIAYKQMREIERRIVVRLHGAADTVEALMDVHSWPGEASAIPLTNFRGIELRDFPAEIARLALIIAEYQCDVFYRGQKDALAEFLPLDAMNWITCGNALRLDWLSICPPTGTGIKLHADDLLESPLEQAEIDFENEGGETYICGNPPYKGSQSQGKPQKSDLEHVFRATSVNWKGLDYVAGWFKKAAEVARVVHADFAFVSTNSICQGKAVSQLWPGLLQDDLQIGFASRNFKWANLASHNAGVTVSIIGVRPRSGRPRLLMELDGTGSEAHREVRNINAYLVPAGDIYVSPEPAPLSKDLSTMVFGNMPIDGGHLSLTKSEVDTLQMPVSEKKMFVRRLLGGAELVRGQQRYCLWLNDENVRQAGEHAEISRRLREVGRFRAASKREATAELASQPHRFGWVAQSGDEIVTCLPRILSERREYITASHEPPGTLTTDQAYVLLNAPVWNLSVLSSKLHRVWISTVCGKLKTDLRYSNTLGWNTFPMPRLTEKNREDLTRCAEEILLSREAHFPSTMAELYDPDEMPSDVHAAHDRNDETIERIYVGRRFRNDTERLEHLFELYVRITRDVEGDSQPPN